MSEYDAPPGYTWVCTACGKLARDRVDGGISPGWDSSCFTWAVLCWTKSIILGATGEVRYASAARGERR